MKMNTDMDKGTDTATDTDTDRDIDISTPLLFHHKANFEIGFWSQFGHCVAVKPSYRPNLILSV
jgi:hypothetical protein